MFKKTIAKTIQYHLINHLDDMLMNGSESIRYKKQGKMLFHPLASYSKMDELINALHYEASSRSKGRQFIYDGWLEKIYKGLINTFMNLQASCEAMTDEVYLKWWNIKIEQLASFDVNYLACDKVVFYDDIKPANDLDFQHTILRQNILKTVSAIQIYILRGKDYVDFNKKSY